MLGDRLRALRESKTLTQADVAKLFNVSTSTIGMYEQDRRDPDTSFIKKFADYFSVSTDYLLGRTDIGAHKRIPLLGIIRAGIPILADENIEGYLDVPETLQADFALRVTGDSMTGAGILDGDLVICKAAETAQSGQIVVALHDQSIGVSDATLKYYYDANGNGPVLRPANPNYPEINMSDGYRIGGVMVGLVREDAPGYQVYKKYIAVPDHDDWTEVIELASQAGLKVNQVKEILAAQIDIAKKFLK